MEIRWKNKVTKDIGLAYEYLSGVTIVKKGEKMAAILVVAEEIEKVLKRKGGE